MESTIQDVARQAKVSVSTVSRSFTRPDLVSERTRAKVLAIADELNFSISRSATALKSGQSLRVAVLINDHLNTWFNSTIMEGFNSVFLKAGYDISICQITSGQARRRFFEELPVKRNVDAVIVTSFDIEPVEISRLISVNVPIVSLNVTEEDGFMASTRIDDEQGGRLSAEHLMALGHRRLAYIRSTPVASLHFSIQARLDGFITACRSRGIEPTVLAAPADDNPIPQVLTQLMNLDQRPTGIACQEDSLAVPLIFQLERCGIQVPGDMSVIGYDDSRFAEDIGLTTIRQQPYDMAVSLAGKTLELIEGRELEHPHDLVSPTLVLRSSTAAPGGTSD